MQDARLDPFFPIISYSSNEIESIKSMVPMTITGELGYATGKYWVTIKNNKVIYISPWLSEKSIENINAFNEKHGGIINLKGSMITYEDGGKYFVPKFLIQKIKKYLNYTFLLMKVWTLW